MCSIIGTFAIGIIGFGWLLVSGRSRVPSNAWRRGRFASSCSKRRTLYSRHARRRMPLGISTIPWTSFPRSTPSCFVAGMGSGL